MKLHKITVALLTLLLSLSITKANEIDSIKTDEDVNQFIRTHFWYKYSDFTVADTSKILVYENYRIIADTLKMKYWYKTDFNSDGESDLLVYGSTKTGNYLVPELIAIVYLGMDIYQLNDLSNNVRHVGTLFPVIDTLNSNVILIRYQSVVSVGFERILDSTLSNYKNQIYNSMGNHTNFYIYSDTLIYKFSAFVEYNSNPTPTNISEIYFENHCGMIACYVMKLTIDNKRNATLIGGEYYGEKTEYITTIDSSNFNKIFNLIKYIGPNRLKDAYSVGYTDASSITIKITFDDDTYKNIWDYGKSGTFGLQKLYQLLFNLKDNQQWEKIN